MKSKLDEIDKLAKTIIENKVCADLAAQATQLVMGDGNSDAGIVFIGEAPGKQEDLQGLPFVGASGKFLSEMLASIGLQRSDVYITNIVKYRPPDNRDPLPQEKAEFMPYLASQLAIIKPKLIVTLGRHAGTVFLPSLKISQEHGQAKRIKMLLPGDAIPNATEKVQIAQVILPLYHPAAALYDGKLRQTLLEDFSRIPSILQQIKES